MAVMSGYIYIFIYIYLYINPCPATDRGTEGAKSSPCVCPELSLLCNTPLLWDFIKNTKLPQLLKYGGGKAGSIGPWLAEKVRLQGKP